MSIFTKPVSEVGTADLQELVAESAVENARLEFKLLAPNKEETLKKLSSFANTFGGYMVIGARADSTDGRIQDLPGVDAVAGYKQKVVQWCFDGASPPLVVEVSDPIPAPAGNGKVCYVAYSAESDIAPHFLNGRKGCWVRIDEFSTRFEVHLANDNELRHLFDRRKLVRDFRDRLLFRAKSRFNIHAGRAHTTSSGGRTKSGPLLRFSVVPRFPSRQLCLQANLKDCIQETRTSWRQGMFPDTGGYSILSQHESAIVLNALKVRGPSFFEANVWGLLFYGVEIVLNNVQTPPGEPGIHLLEFVAYILVFIRQAGEMLSSMGYSGPILIDTALDSILSVPWLLPYEGYLSARPGSELDDNVAFIVPTTSEALREKPDGVAMEILRYVLFSVNLPGLADTDQLENVLRLGYRYNQWAEPASLRT